MRACAMLVMILAAGCAGGPRPTELVEADRALSRARESAQASSAYVELREAELALRTAKESSRANPSGAESREASYLAARLADRARFAAIYEADLQSLQALREKARRLRESVARLQQAQADRARAALADASARQRLREEQARALESASFGTTTRDGPRVVLGMPAGALFIPGYPLLREASPPRVEAIAAALRAGPPSRILIEVTEDVGGAGHDPSTMARRRADRLREELVRHGVRLEIMDTDGRYGPKAAVDIVITEDDEVVPPVLPNGIDGAAPAGSHP